MVLSPFQIIMLSLMLGAAFVSRSNARGLMWLAVQAASYLTSSMWWNAGGAQPELVAGLCDALTCFLLFRFGRRLWECWVWAVFLVCLAVNIGYLAHNLGGLHVISQDVYGTLLEVLNALALGTIGVVSSMARGGADGWAFHPWRTVFGVVRPLAWQGEGAAAQDDR